MPATDSLTPPSLAARLDAARQELLDLGLRNPLLNFRLAKTQGVAVAREKAAAVYEVLVTQGKTMYFQAGPELKPAVPAGAADPAGTAASLPPPLSEAEQQALLGDNKLQTDELLARLESRLLNTYYTARSSLEEQGVNILYLALGMLSWYEADSSEEVRQAPLVLVPVLLERGSAAERFRLRYTGAEVEGNLSLQAKLKASFGLTLPELDEDAPLDEYYRAVQAAVAGRPRWRVEADHIALSFFSFSKFLLYRDLDPANWPAGHPLLDHPALWLCSAPTPASRMRRPA
jgi:hypothetical protein